MSHLSRPLSGCVVLGIAAALSACADDPIDPHDDAFCRRALEDPESVDVFEWLKDPHGGPKRLGSLSNEQSLSLAHQIEFHGGSRIRAVNIFRSSTPEPQQLAEGFVALLPEDPEKRRSLFELYAKVARSAGLSPRADRGQQWLCFPAVPNVE